MSPREKHPCYIYELPDGSATISTPRTIDMSPPSIAHLRMGDETNYTLHDSHAQHALLPEAVTHHRRRHALIGQIWPHGYQDDVRLHRGGVHPKRIRHPQVVQTLFRSGFGPCRP